MSPSDLCARIYALETRLAQTDAALQAERTRSANLAAACHAWARAADLQAKRQPLIAGGAPRRVPLPAFGARSYGTDDGEFMSFAEWSDRRAGRDSEDSYRD